MALLTTLLLGSALVYKPNDQWVVAVSYLNSGMVRMVDDASARQSHYGDPELFTFRVVSVKEDGEAEIEVTRQGPERIKRMTITVNRQLHLTSKKTVDPGLPVPLTVAFDGQRNLPMGFEAFPVELPDFDGAQALTAARRPALPAPLARIFKRRLLPSRTTAFESRDLFSRPIRVSWQRGDLWPSIVETPSSVAVLLRQERP